MGLLYSLAFQHSSPGSVFTDRQLLTHVLVILQLAAERSAKEFLSVSMDEDLKVMLKWAFNGFKPLGPQGFQPPSDSHGMGIKGSF